MKLLPTLALGMLAGVLPGIASAHAHLSGASTDANQLKLVFSEGLEAAFCQISVSDIQGRSIETRAPMTAPDDKRVLLVQPATALPPGEYDLKWRVVSVDTHASNGTFHFIIKP
ncbi:MULTISPECIES: copper resistance protein CopC [unclassified Pseudomonas]|uniref:copper resistance protein CopC n=1 Tax=unclassified Pseudomonas TaxID=196821 RepID=UPI000BC9DCB9|nr:MULTISPECIES: copper resistance protein CopC [unclassified Pseudomonas]PVZ19833.1 hypothetical protein F474_00423 [Pseudomonas sp. URIL14HWK12:I12]PVZ26899.1 hypothetical protein F470_00078 [Pseudomonas sp. URIL14HWK12:I10]PVZ37788.1 hypothetical protein F472_00423 [Pseudomonas sp. URIL14HWK12:I11]SNZ05666.1 hypothetical protein SAMN05660463_00981 [Pseudomonas sp. URIL14HWK12:I9]